VLVIACFAMADALRQRLCHGFPAAPPRTIRCSFFFDERFRPAEAEPGRFLAFRIRPPVAAHPEGGAKDPPLECDANIPETHAKGDSNGGYLKRLCGGGIITPARQCRLA
jgi:hypothetical protein